MLSTLEIAPGSPVVEADIAARTHLGRTPVSAVSLPLKKADSTSSNTIAARLSMISIDIVHP